LFLFNKRVLKFFRRDGHNWRKKKDGRSVGEAHERLKVLFQRLQISIFISVLLELLGTYNHHSLVCVVVIIFS
jgi:hypothetical protein